MRDALTNLWGGAWQWFVDRAKGPHAVFWLVVCAICDPIFFPVAPEIYLAALMLARPGEWRRFVPICIAASTVGAALGYFVGAFLFYQFGAGILSFFHLREVFEAVQEGLGAGVFTTMGLAPFTVIPEKVFVLAAGFVGAPFVLYIIGFFIGRAFRISLIAYLIHRFGERVLGLVSKYFLWFTLVLLALIGIYVTLRLQLLPL